MEQMDQTVYHKCDTKDRVFFYEQEFYVFSNFSSFKLLWNHVLFDTSEAAYHYEKFPDRPDIQMLIRYANSAHDAFEIAQHHKEFRRTDWDDVKVEIMRNILREKVKQHLYVFKKLLQVGNREPVEDSWRDSYWGWGPNKDGKNMLGKLWKEIQLEYIPNYKLWLEQNNEGTPEIFWNKVLNKSDSNIYRIQKECFLQYLKDKDVD